MGNLIRFGISLDKELLDKFDVLLKERGYRKRSKAISDLIRTEFVKEEWQKGDDVAGSITIVYSHHKREIVDKLIHIQHNFQNIVVSMQHIHLDHHNCLEMLAVKGKVVDVTKLSDSLKSVKGVKHITLSMSTTGRDL